MAKTIKFNLICDGYPIRTIEDLQSHFVVEDVLFYYFHSEKLLERWLEVRGYAEQLAAVQEINETRPQDVIKRLIAIFGLDEHDDQLERDIAMLDLLEQRKRQKAKIEEQDQEDADTEAAAPPSTAANEEQEAAVHMQTVSSVEEYFNGYQSCIDTILNNAKNIVTIKQMLKEIIANYAALFDKDYRRLFYLFQEKAPLASYCLFMYPEMRKYYWDPDDMIDYAYGDDEYECNEDGVFRKLAFSYLERGSQIVHDKFTKREETRSTNAQQTKDRLEMHAVFNCESDGKLQNQLAGHVYKIVAGVNNKHYEEEFLDIENFNLIEPEGKKVLVVAVYTEDNSSYPDMIQDYNMQQKVYMFETGKVRYPFLLLNGLRYRPAEHSSVLYYMEV